MPLHVRFTVGKTIRTAYLFRGVDDTKVRRVSQAADSVGLPPRRVTGGRFEFALPACGTLPKKAQWENRYG